jgi:hypothetical protein
LLLALVLLIFQCDLFCNMTADEDFGEDEGDSDSSPRNSTKSRAVHSKSRAAPRLNQSRAQSAGVVRSRRGYAHSGQSSNTTQPWVSISPRKSPGRAAKKEFEATKRKAKVLSLFSYTKHTKHTHCFDSQKSSFKRSSESGTRAPLKMDVVRTSDRKRMTSLMVRLCAFVLRAHVGVCVSVFLCVCLFVEGHICCKWRRHPYPTKQMIGQAAKLAKCRTDPPIRLCQKSEGENMLSMA